MDSDYFTLDIKAVDKALEIINHFNQLNILNKTVKVNVPEVWVWGGITAGRARKASLNHSFRITRSSIVTQVGLMSPNHGRWQCRR